MQSKYSKTKTAERQETIIHESRSAMPLLRNNFIIMIIAAVMIIVGFVLIGGSSSGVETFNPDIFSTRRIVVGPMLSFLGFVLMAIAIVVKPKTK